MPKSALLSVVRRFIETDPGQAAAALEGLPEADAADLIRHLPLGSAVSCLERIRPSFAAAVLGTLPPETAGSLLEKMSSDHAADTFRSLPNAVKQAVLEKLGPERKKDIQEILSYPEESAGRLMKTEVLALPKELKVKEAIHRLRTLAQKTVQSHYTYVVGPENKLIGVLNMRDILLGGPDESLETVMRTDVFSVPAFTDREELVHLASQRHLLSMPVVDPQGRLIGVIRTEDLLESSQEEASEDLQLLFGASAEERPFSPLRFKLLRRLPWLHINLATAFLAASVVAIFEDLIGRIAILAVFLPVVAGQGGNAGAQSLAVVLRGLVMREVRLKDAWRLMAVEASAGFLNGAVIGVVTALGAWFWHGNPYLGLVIGMAMVVNLVAAGLAGAAIPLAMKKLGFDPAQSSGIFLTTVTDVVGFFSFLGFAMLFQNKLL